MMAYDEMVLCPWCEEYAVPPDPVETVGALTVTLSLAEWQEIDSYFDDTDFRGFTAYGPIAAAIERGEAMMAAERERA